MESLYNYICSECHNQLEIKITFDKCIVKPCANCSAESFQAIEELNHRLSVAVEEREL